MVSLRRGVPLLVVLVGTLLLLLLLIGNGVEASSTSTTTNIVWVGSLPPPSYCAELPLCGSNSTCYCTSIQQAIDTIADLQPAAAYQILVLPGEYYGTSNTQLQLPALKNVSLVSQQGSHATKLVCKSTSLSASPPAIATGANSTGSIEGFHITNCTQGPTVLSIAYGWTGVLHDLSISINAVRTSLSSLININASPSVSLTNLKLSVHSTLDAAVIATNSSLTATDIGIDYTGANGIQGINSNLTCTRCKFYQHGILTSSRKPVSAIYLTSQYLVRGYLTLSIASSNFTPSHDVPIAARDSVISATNITHIWISESGFNLHRFNGLSALEFSGCQTTITDSHFFDLRTPRPNAVLLASQSGLSNPEAAAKTTAATTTTTNTESEIAPAPIGRRGSLTLTKCAFYNNHIHRDGSAIVFVHKQLTVITDCTFRNNSALLYGALALAGADYLGSTSVVTATITNTTFIDNTSSRAGGAIYSDGAFSTTVEQCTFVRNYASRGGAIGIAPVTALYDRLPTIIKHSTFDSNVADRMGGAIMCHDEERSPLADLLQLQVMHSNFTRNRGLDGGSLALISSSALVQGCSFIGDETDTVSSGVTSGIGGGGAIFCSTCDKTSIADSFFASCHAKASNGGAIFVQTLGSVAVTRSIFVNNSAEELGGAIALMQTNGLSSVMQCDFISNSGYGGGAIALTDSAMIDSCRFDFNRASGWGGGVYLSKHASPIVTNCHFTNCSSSSIGGSIAASQDVGGSFTNCTVRNSRSVSSGGSISLVDRVATYFYNCTISNGKSIDNGGAIYITDAASPRFSLVTVSDNDCISSGGALVAISQCSPTFVDVVFQRNSAASFGGALYLGGETNVTFVRCSLLENSTPNDAGALWLSDTATANFVDSQFISNRAKATGGVMMGQVGAKATFIRCEFGNNSASSTGGVMQLMNGFGGRFESCRFVGNEAAEGGAINLADQATVECIDSSFSDNIALNLGGAVIARSFSEANFSACNFTNNRSPTSNGGVMALLDSARIWVVHSTFEQNTAAAGGVVHAASRREVTFDACTFLSNTADVAGGVLNSVAPSTIMVTGSHFWNNSAMGSGGIASCGTDSSIMIDSSTIDSNRANLEGGAIVMATLCTLDIHASNLSSNNAQRGGVVYAAREARLQVSLSNVHDNTAQTGGAFYLLCSKAAIVECTFDSNTASSNGGAISIGTVSAVLYSEFVVANSTFDHNVATHFGGALHVWSSTATPDYYLYSPSSLADLLGQQLDDDDGDSDAERARRAVPTLPSFYNFAGVSFQSNRASKGGAYYFASTSDLDPVNDFDGILTLGEGVLFANNSATAYGGAIYQQTFQPVPWISAAVFDNNQAEYAGGHVGFNNELEVEPSAALSFCANCTFGPSTSGYQTPNGFASSPMFLQFLSGCESSYYVGTSWFEMELMLTDTFGTNVQGPILQSETFFVTLFNTSLAGKCELSGVCDSMLINNATGRASWNVSFVANDNQVCVFEFILSNKTNDMGMCNTTLVFPSLQCRTPIDGCPAGNHVVTGSPYDSCAVDPPPFDFWTSSIFHLLLGIVSICIAILFLTALLYAVSWYARKRRELTLAIDAHDEEEAMIVHGSRIEHMLQHDAAIPRIEFTDLALTERQMNTPGSTCFRGVWCEQGFYPEVEVSAALVVGTHDFSTEELECLFSAIKLYSVIRHKNVMLVYGVSVAPDDRVFLVREPTEHGNLRNVLDTKPLSWSTKLGLARQICSGMAHLHKRKIMHLQLRPESVFVTQSWECKVADYTVSPEEIGCIPSAVYSAPEFIRKQNINFAADVWSFGMLLYELWSGSPPYAQYIQSNSLEALLELRKLENELPTVDDSNSALTALLQDCWQLEPSLRPSFVEINIRLSRMQHLGDDDDGNNDDDDVNPPQPERSLSTGEVELEMLPTSSTPRSLPRHLQRHPNLESDDDLTPASEFESYGSLLDVGFAQRMRQK